MKILHSADWHLDSAFVGLDDQQARFFRNELRKIPDKVVSLCKAEGCDMMLLSGDLFDGPYTKESYHAISSALAEANVPVFITPGNHDYCSPDSAYLSESWPDNVHIFTRPVIESVTVPELDCRIYGAGYIAMDGPDVLQDLQKEGTEKWHIGVLHLDPLQKNSPYSPMTPQQLKDCPLHYLAAGHIHKGGSFRSGNVLCAWPGCPMGRNYNESGMKGVLLVTLEEQVSAQFLPLNTIRFYDETVDVGDDAAAAVAALLPPVETQDFYRITLTGYCPPIDAAAITSAVPHVPNLDLRDRTLPEMDLWSIIDEDSLEGVYFRILHDGLDTESEKLQQHLKLAAKISRQILDGQEVTLP